MQSETYPEGLFGGERLANCADKPVRHEGRVVWVRTMLGGVFMIDTPEQPIPIAFRADCEGRKLPKVGQRVTFRLVGNRPTAVEVEIVK